MNKDLTARETILNQVRAAIGSHPGVPLQPPPPSARFEPRKAAALDDETATMIREVEKLSGHARRIRGRDEFAAALAELIAHECSHKRCTQIH